MLVGPPGLGQDDRRRPAWPRSSGVAFRDTDADIEDVAGTSVADLFIQHGEQHFRALEEQAVARALAEHDGVLALGGGAVTSAATRELLVAHGRRGTRRVARRRPRVGGQAGGPVPRPSDPRR